MSCLSCVIVWVKVVTDILPPEWWSSSELSEESLSDHGIYASGSGFDLSILLLCDGLNKTTVFRPNDAIYRKALSSRLIVDTLLISKLFTPFVLICSQFSLYLLSGKIC